MKSSLGSDHAYTVCNDCLLTYIFRLNKEMLPFEIWTPDGTEEKFPRVNCSEPSPWPRHEVKHKKKLFNGAAVCRIVAKMSQVL